MSDLKKRGLGRGLSALFGDAKNENITEKTSTMTTNLCSSERSVQETLSLNSSKESLM